MKYFKFFILSFLILFPFTSTSYGMYSTGKMSYSCKENTSKNYRAYTWKFSANLFKNSFNGTHTFYRSELKRDIERTFSGYIDMGKLYIKSEMNDVVPQKQGDRIKDRMKKHGYTINFKNLNLNNKNLKQVLFEGVEAEEGGRTCILKLVKLEEQKQKITKNLIKNFSDNEICSNAVTFKNRTKNWGQSIEFFEEAKNRGLSCDVIVVAQEAPKTELSQNKAKEHEARKRALAEKKAEELAKQKAIVAKKAKKDKARKKALAKEKAEKLAKQKAIAAKKAEEDALKKKVLNEKIQKIKDEAQFIVATLKEYVTTDNNKLDILEVSELLENYNSEKQKGWSDTTVEKYEEFYDYVQKDEGFIDFSAEKKSKQLAEYNEEIIQLREYLTNSQSKLKDFITKNLGSNNAKKALKLAKETKQVLKDFEVSKAMTLKNNIATWKAMNGVKEYKIYKFKLLAKETGIVNETNKYTKNKNSLANNDDSYICSNATINKNGTVCWNDWPKYLKEAKRRGLDCGVKKNSKSISACNKKAKTKKGKSTRARMKCVPFGAKEDHATNRIMAKIAKQYCTHVTKGKVYLETMTGRYQSSVVCHYSNGKTMGISAPLYYKSGCSRYLAY